MTNPRIEPSRPESAAHVGHCEIDESSYTRPSRAAAAANDSHTPADEVLDFFDDAYAITKQEASELFAGLDGAENVQTLCPGQRAVGEIQLGFGIAKGLGLDVGGKLAYAVERNGDRYDATFEASGSAALQVGAGLEEEGVKLEAGLGAGKRLTVQGKGAEARDELARIVDLTDPEDVYNAIRNSKHLEVTRVEVGGGPSVAAKAGLGIRAKGAAETQIWVGADPRGEGRAFVRREASSGVRIDSPAVEVADLDAATALVRHGISQRVGIPVDMIPEAAVRAAIEANGGLIGLELGAQVSVAFETEGNFTQKVDNVKLGISLIVGGRRIELEGRASATLQLNDVEAVLEQLESQPEEAVEQLQRLGLTVAADAKVVDFHGVRASGGPFVEGRSGKETVTTVGELQGTIR